MGRGAGKNEQTGLATLRETDEYRLQMHHGPGVAYKDFRGTLDISIPGEHVLICENNEGDFLGCLLWQECTKGSKPRKSIEKDYIFLHIAWVEPDYRGKGVFSQLSQRLIEEYPDKPIVGIPNHDALRLFFNKVETLPGRASEDDFKPYQLVNAP
jgi:GNAT superfamily N-acetyltransferase